MLIPANKLVAHRGYQLNFPENSVLSITSAISAGAQWVEFDVQLNDEGISFVYHDDNLERVSGVKGSLHESSVVEISKLFASEPKRLGKYFADNPITLLVELLPTIYSHPLVSFFIELKEESIQRYGAKSCVEAMAAVLGGTVPKNCILISSDAEAVSVAKRLGFAKTGLVIKDWLNRQRLLQLVKPDFLFINYQRIPAKEKIIASVPVVVYETCEPDIINELLKRGAFAVETFCFNDIVEPETHQIVSG